jgi:hypothetical protein
VKQDLTVAKIGVQLQQDLAGGWQPTCGAVEDADRSASVKSQASTRALAGRSPGADCPPAATAPPRCGPVRADRAPVAAALAYDLGVTGAGLVQGAKASDVHPGLRIPDHEGGRPFGSSAWPLTNRWVIFLRVRRDATRRIPTYVLRSPNRYGTVTIRK